MKVFVLVTEWCIDYENGIDCIGVYETKKQAISAMLKDKDSPLNIVKFNNQIEVRNDDSISIYEDGEYSCNHIGWTIYEQEIVFNNEQLNTLQL